MARALVESDLGRPLDRVTPIDQPTVDYRLADGSVGVEVKRITSEAYNELTAAFAGARHIDSELLTGRWTAMIERPTLSTTLQPLPKFAPDDEGTIESLQAAGFTVKRLAEREAEWRASHPGPRTQSPRLARLAEALEPHLAVMELHSLTSTHGVYPYGQPIDLATAVVEIARLASGGLCHRHEPFTGQRPGVDLALSSGYTRTGRPDTVVGRIELWLDSDLSANLRDSLRNEPPDTVRHAVLVFDAATEPEHSAAQELGTDFLPTAQLRLPPEIDVLWFVLGEVACRYERESGWRALEVPSVEERAR